MREIKLGGYRMKKFCTLFIAAFLIVSLYVPSVSAASNAISHTVVRGDTMWKLAVKYQVGVSEIINANPVSYTHLDVYKRQLENALIC